MQRYFIHFSYDGTPYHGFQTQPGAVTVQETLEKGLSTLLRREVGITGAGRTDAGVHARRMTAHFDLDGVIDTEALVYRLNKILPRSVAVARVEAVAPEMHARFSALRRTYRYYVHTRKDPFLDAYSAYITYPLDFDRMNLAARRLLETEDFAAFCKSGAGSKTTLCRVTAARWVKTSDCTWYFEITANRFLRNMVRAVVGTLVEVGRGRMSPDGFEAVILGRDRQYAGESMPARALFLEDVVY